MSIFGKKLDRHFWVWFNNRAGEFVFLLTLFGFAYFVWVGF